jgi:hypothetical protein
VKPYDQYYEIHYSVVKAVRSGDIVKAISCEVCSGTNVPLHAHHYNGYDDEHVLDVQWLCKPCHSSAHGQDESRSRAGKTRWLDVSAEQRSEIMSDQWQNYTDDERRRHAEGIRAYWASMTPEERTARMSEPVKASREKFTTDRRSEAVRASWAKLTPEERSRRARGTRSRRDHG